MNIRYSLWRPRPQPDEHGLAMTLPENTSSSSIGRPHNDSCRTLLLATRNAGKTRELRSLLEPLGWTILNAADIDLPEIAELTAKQGATFAGNARLKAEHGSLFSGFWTLADDSGLCVDALGGNPGVDTAHYGGYEKLLDALAGIEKQQRTAFFECVLALARPGLETLLFEGRAHGVIAEHPHGTQGFGYDPVFVPEGYDQTFAEMSGDMKMATSHRGKALKRFLEYMEHHAS